MGIPPYMTPVERKRMNAELQAYRDFVKAKGYENCYTINPDRPDSYLRRKGFKTPTGVYCETAEDFYKSYGCYPSVEKDGLCYGWYEVGRIEGWKDPWDEEVNFLVSRGYVRLNPTSVLSEDYLENNELLREHYEKHGWVPRWEKDGVRYGHEQALERENALHSVPKDLVLHLENNNVAG